nr:eukaryotic translation initiation factor 3 subunit A-like [Tanacetum cinerariifolium]
MARLHEFKGLDLYVTPLLITKGSMTNLRPLLDEMRVDVDTQNLTLTMGSHYSLQNNGLSYPVHSVGKNFDWVHVRSYDYYTSLNTNIMAAHSAFYDPSTKLGFINVVYILHGCRKKRLTKSNGKHRKNDKKEVNNSKRPAKNQIASREVSKGVMTYVTSEVKDLYHLLENEFLPLDLALKVQPFLTKISKLGGKISSASFVPDVQLSQYIPDLEKVATLRCYNREQVTNVKPQSVAVIMFCGCFEAMLLLWLCGFCCSKVELLGDKTDIVPLSYHIVDNFEILFGREEFCLVTGLRFGVEYSADYNNEDEPIPFRRRVFSSAKDGFEDRSKVLDWIIRLANDRDGWDKRYPRAVAWHAKRKFFRNMLRDHLPIARLTPDDTEAGLGWWVSSRNFIDNWMNKKGGGTNYEKDVERDKMYDQVRNFMNDMNVGSVQQAKKELIIVGQHYEISDLSRFQSLQMPSHSGTPNRQTPIPSHPHDAGLFNPNILNRERREVRSSIYSRTPFMDLPPITVLPKKHGDKTKNKVKNANVSPLNLGNAFADGNVGGDDVMIMGERDTGNLFVYENFDPSKSLKNVGSLQSYVDWPDEATRRLQIARVRC